MTTEVPIGKSFTLKLPFTLTPEYVVELPRGNKANVFRSVYVDYNGDTRHDVPGWRINYEGPVAGKSMPFHQNEILQNEWEVNDRLQQVAKQLLSRAHAGAEAEDESY